METMLESPLLITGGAGYIGSHVALALRAAGYPVVVLDDLSNGRRTAIPGDMVFVEGNASDFELVRRLVTEHRIGAVIHMAASISVPESVRDPLGYYHNNSSTTAVLIRACVDGGVRRFVYSSTAAVYGTPASIPISEDAPTIPINPYGASKLAGEWMVRDAAAAHGLSCVVLRYFNVAGADPQGRTGPSDLEPAHLITAACDSVLGLRGPLTLFGTDYDTPDGTCIRDYIHVSDIAEAHVAGLRRLETHDAGVFNCGYGRGFSVREVITAVEKTAGRPLDIRSGPRRIGDPAALVANATRARTDLGWQPRYDDLDVIARTTLAWRKRLVEADGITRLQDL